MRAAYKEINLSGDKYGFIVKGAREDRRFSHLPEKRCQEKVGPILKLVTLC